MKSLRNKIKEFVIILSIVTSTTGIFVILVYYKILPIRGSILNNKNFKDFRELLYYWLLLIVIFMMIPYLLPFFRLKKEVPIDLICPTCEEVITLNSNKLNEEVTCKKCGIKMVLLKGFYENKQKQ